VRYGAEFLGLFADGKLKNSNSILHSQLQNQIPLQARSRCFLSIVKQGPLGSSSTIRNDWQVSFIMVVLIYLINHVGG
jgi:hypothetical protein